MGKRDNSGFDLGPEPDPEKDQEKDRRDNKKIINNLRAGRKVDDTRGNED